MRIRPIDLCPLNSEAEEQGVRVVGVECVEGRCVESLVSFVETHREALYNALLVHGGVLFRGFRVFSASKFELVARAFTPDLGAFCVGSFPRTLQHGTQNVYKNEEFPSFVSVPPHCDITYNKAPPKITFMGCIQSAIKGGDTTLCDVRQVYADLTPEVRGRWEHLGIRYIRTYVDKPGWLESVFPCRAYRWKDVFETDDPRKVDVLCQEGELVRYWHKTNLRVINVRPAVETHPLTGKNTFFNEAHLFDIWAVPSEIRRMNKVLNSWFLTLLRWVILLFVLLRCLLTRPEDLPLHVTFGDGTRIPNSDLEHVRDVMWRHTRSLSWQGGDVLVLDNYAMAHGRMPFHGPRNVVMAFGKYNASSDASSST